MLIELKEEHLKKVLNISKTVFGEGFLTDNQLHTYLKNETKKGFVLTAHNQVLGFITVEILTPDHLNNSLLKDGRLIHDKLSNCSSIGFIKQVIIHPEHQQKGLGKQMIKATIQQLNKDVGAWLCIAWMQGKVIPIEKALLINHFKKEVVIENYWKEDSLTNKYNCIVCGTPPCKCNAVVYLLHKKAD